MKKLFTLLLIFASLTVMAAWWKGTTPLMDAAEEGDINTVKALLDKGEDVNKKGPDYTALMVASARGNTDVVRLLIDRGADVNMVVSTGMCALAFAVENGHTGIVEFLVEKGADIDKAIKVLEKRTSIFVHNPLTSFGDAAKSKSGLALLNEKYKKQQAKPPTAEQAKLPTQGSWAYYNGGKYQEALNSFKKDISLDPSNSDNFAGLAASHNKLKQYDEAITAGKRAIELKPDSAFVCNELGIAYSNKKRFNEALSAYRKAIEIEPKNTALYYNIGDLFSQKEDYGRAADSLQKAVELAPRNTVYLSGLASIYRRMGRYDDAIEMANKAVALTTITGVGLPITIVEDYPVVQGLAEGPAKRAGIEAGDKIIEVNGLSTKGWNIDRFVGSVKGSEGTQVVFAIERKNLDKPIEKTLTREVVVLKDGAPFLGFRSLCYREKSDLENAFKDAEKAYFLNPDDGWAKSAMALAYIDKGRYNDTLNILSTIKDSPFDRILEATAQAKLGDMKKAVEIYSSIPEDYLASQKATYRQSYKRALLESLKPYANAKKDSARSFEAKRQYGEALKEHAELLKVADEREAKEIRSHAAALIKENPYLATLPEEGRKYALRAEILLKDGKFEESLSEFDSAIKVAPFFPQLYYNKALVYGEMKNYRSAKRYMEIYLDLYPNAPNIRQVKDEIYKWEFMMEREGK